MTYNGEIYNFKELKKILIGKGHEFHTNCDTEIVIHSYMEWGENAFSYFDGMFVGYWDSSAKKLVLARDRRGVKPLYWSIIDQNCFFHLR